MRWVHLSLSSALLFACGEDDARPPIEASPAGYDEAIDPAALAAQEGKADAIDCAAYDDGTADGASLLVLVNKATALKGSYRPADLLPIPSALMIPDRRSLLRAGPLAGLEALATAALDAGFDLRARSAYRGFREQCFTFDYWVQRKGVEHADRYSARPGRSQHQLGTTVDITAESWGWAIEPEVAQTAEAAWLFANAGRFGFALSYPEGAEAITGYAFEPWHYRYIGVEAAAEMEAAGLILETYLRACADPETAFACPEEVQPAVPVNHRFIGGACGSDDDCESLGEGAVCLLDGHPDGHCTVPCTRGCPDRAGNNQTTFCHAERDGAAWCRSRCDFARFASGCRAGYACLDGARPEMAGTAEVCLPDPALDAD